ncbi:MAG: hypothetical protein GF411_08585 [Candidatus Lokiarchaeota archaeon]|nr:hypothetical protein [Candidatus Lokiarchaeota archaeon]
MRSKKSTTGIYSKLLYYQDALNAAHRICVEYGLSPSKSNIISIMGKDFFEMEELVRDFQKFKKSER